MLGSWDPQTDVKRDIFQKIKSKVAKLYEFALVGIMSLLSVKVILFVKNVMVHMLRMHMLWNLCLIVQS